MPLIKLTKITHAGYRDEYSNSDDVTEGTAGQATTPCVVNAAAIRCYYPRKNNQPGTRITFTDGGGFAVTESFGAICELLGVDPAVPGEAGELPQFLPAPAR